MSDIHELENLEKEMQNVLACDEKYWRENDAKFRAVSQNATYDQFEEIVKASHLKPLEKKDKSPSQKSNKSSIWNSISLSTSKKGPSVDPASNFLPSTTTCKPSNTCTTQTALARPSSVKNIDEFVCVWRSMEIGERIDFVGQLGPDLRRIFHSEIPPELLGEMLHTFLAFRPTIEDISTVVKSLDAVSGAKRFRLSVQFLSSFDRTAASQLIEKLFASLSDRQQDLAELGVTEYAIHNLANKLNISAKHTGSGAVCS